MNRKRTFTSPGKQRRRQVEDADDLQTFSTEENGQRRLVSNGEAKLSHQISIYVFAMFLLLLCCLTTNSGITND